MQRKIDLLENGDCSKCEPQGRIYPIRVSPTTVFMVTKDKNTPEYAAKLREKYNQMKFTKSDV
jgi:hypothetical protein